MDKALEIKRAPRGNQVTLMSWSVDYVPAEQNLETIGYFSARYARRALDEKQKSKVIVLSDSRRIEIVPSMKYGFPNAEDLDFYRAFLKICDADAEIRLSKSSPLTILTETFQSPLSIIARNRVFTDTPISAR